MSGTAGPVSVRDTAPQQRTAQVATIAGPIEPPVNVGGECGLGGAEGACRSRGHQSLLDTEFTFSPRAAPPFIQHDGRHTQALAVRDQSTQHACLAALS